MVGDVTHWCKRLLFLACSTVFVACGQDGSVRGFDAGTACVDLDGDEFGTNVCKVAASKSWSTDSRNWPAAM